MRVSFFTILSNEILQINLQYCGRNFALVFLKSSREPNRFYIKFDAFSTLNHGLKENFIQLNSLFEIDKSM